MYRLFGDANGDWKVNSTDFAAMPAVFGQIGPTIFAFERNNLPNAADLGRYRARFGITLTS